MNKLAVMERNFNAPKITDKTLTDIKNNPKLYRGHVNTTVGKIYKSGEFEIYSDYILNKKLP